jgi:hypothetical protein
LGVKGSWIPLSFRKPVHDNTFEALWPCCSNKSLIGDFLLCSSNRGIVDILLKADTRVMNTMKKLSLDRLIVSNDDMGRITWIVALKGQCGAATDDVRIKTEGD